MTYGLNGRFIVCAPDTPRAGKPEDIALELKKYHDDVMIAGSVREAVRRGMEEMKGKNDLMVVTGSLYTMEEAIGFL